MIGVILLQYRPVHRRILAIDIERFSRDSWGDPVRVRVRWRLHRLVDEALTRTGIRLAATSRRDTGDGMFLLVDAVVPIVHLLGPFLTSLAGCLARDNAEAASAERLRLRVVVHAGEVLDDPFGFTGQSVIVAARLLDADVGRAVLGGVPAAHVVVLASEWVHAEVIRHGYDEIDPTAWQSAWAAIKGGRLRTWIHVLGVGSQPPLASIGGARDPEVGPTSSMAGPAPGQALDETDASEPGRGGDPNEAGDALRRRELLTYAGVLFGELGVDTIWDHQIVRADDVLVTRRVTKRLRGLRESMSAARCYRLFARHAAGVDRLAKRTTNPRTRAEFLEVLAITQAQAGWIAAFDLQVQPLAAERFRSALRAAHEVDNPVLGAAVCLKMADSALYAGDISEALELAQVGRALMGSVDAALEVSLLTTIAHAWGRKGDEALAMNALGEAERMVFAPGFGPSQWAQMDSVRFAGDRGLLSLMLGRFGPATVDLRATIAAQPSGNGHRAMLSSALATALFEQGAVDEAVAAGHACATALTHLDSRGRAARLAELGPYLRRHARHPGVGALAAELGRLRASRPIRD